MGNSYSAKIWSVKPKAGVELKGWEVFVRKKAPLGINKKAAGKMKMTYRWPEDERPIIFP